MQVEAILHEPKKPGLFVIHNMLYRQLNYIKVDEKANDQEPIQSNSTSCYN